MVNITKADLSNLARKRRVRSLHQWYAAFQRSANKHAVPEAANAPKYASPR